MNDKISVTNKADAQRAPNPLIDKLGRVVPLNDEEREELRRLCLKSHQIRRGTHLIAEGDKPNSVFLILEGWAFRYKHLADGSRQIMAYLLPGDLCDIRIFLFEEMDHSIGLLSDAKVVKIPAADMLNLLDRYPRIERALYGRRWSMNRLCANGCSMSAREMRCSASVTCSANFAFA